MNDVDRIDELREAIHANVENRRDFRRIAFALLVLYFFFNYRVFYLSMMADSIT